ncbi:flagellar basal-body MS-ring/collar protein FliF [Cochlodiniinecator piscidefendens]|uniref:flagellar basal-body MS-ring/collar protein FliF n=1 Tax=Cochlodiniinecator piscidefendens TaxID=2715756 RepID=UPI00140E205D
MQQLSSAWTALDGRKRAIVLLAVVAVFASIITMSRMAMQPNLSLLYSGLETGAAGDVVRSLEQRGVPYDVRGGSIFVPAAQRDELRMTLASEGLPANGGAGYELLDSLSGFGTTSQMFDAAYWRAKEGELARTIVSSPAVRSARVHISNPSSQPFRRELAASASVFVTPASNTVSPGQARSFRFLVASAVSGLSVENVSVIDGQSGQIIGVDDANNSTGDDRAQELKLSVERILAARVGAGNAVVEVSVETNSERETIVERRFDPETRVAISTDTEERTTNSQNSGSNAVTVASNLPDGQGTNEGQTSNSQDSETRSRVNFEVSETQREIERAPGAVRRITVAVLVNNVEAVNDTGQIITEPRGEEELLALQELVSSTVGFDEARGDVITIKSMEFQPIEELGTSAIPAGIGSLNLDVMSLIQIAVLGIVALLLGLFVVKPVLTSGASAPLPLPLANTDRDLVSENALQPSVAQQNQNLGALTGEIDDGDFIPGNMSLVGGGADQAQPNFVMGQDTPADPVDRLRGLIEDRQQEAVEILRSWMEETEERT